MNIDHIPTPLFIAHRGLSARFPENTLAAFKGAVDAGAHMIELDVSLTRDRQLVVIHDDTVDRTTDGSGSVRALTLEEIGRMDGGSWFDPAFEGERLPTLAQVLDAVKGRLLVNIEIKPEAFERHQPADAVERQVVQLVREKNMRDDVLVSSFEWQVLENIYKMEPAIALGLLSDVAADERLHHWHQRVKAFSWHPDYRVLTPDQVKAFHDLGARVFPFSVEGRIDTRAMLAMGVDGLMVDDPRQMTVW
jgi:glycerophosphoryl diester phosphodiesterase